MGNRQWEFNFIISWLMSLFFENDFSNPDIFWYIGYIYVIAYYYNILVN